ncbi:MAG TPA: hypothetical protein VGS22_26765 [Thermoanaerobaculia bacterium]|jgi:hypothetical protein|nr:hypothetical protein [Thermoanaerobaculia bacterium]
MDWLEVTIPSGRTAFAPGEEIEAAAVWRLDELPKSLEVRLFWFTEGKGDRDTELVLAESIEPSPSGHRTCRFRLPEIVPSSFSGKLVSLLWAIELVAEPGDRAGRVDLVVSPTGKELRLYGDGPNGGADASA